MGLNSGTKLGSYEILSPLGAGGMGEVYRATDTKLGRDVALKVLPAELAHDPERLGRFRREAKTLAQLDHPNIVTIYSVEESNGIHFLTMQLVDGQALDRLIPQDGLPIERITEVGSALADALAAAHEKGIVHRDLKPANVMVSHEGRVKVLDFGLAKDVRAAHLTDATLTSDSRTQVGVVMGTPAYMSPEQTSGRPLDHRTDIFSLGVVLHEMATGRRPFEGTSSAELVSAILRDTPPSVTDLRSDLPADLARIIRRCLEKDPRHRMQTARDVSNEFRDLARTTTRPAPASTPAARPAKGVDSGTTRADEGFWVAVLPFKFKGTDPGLDALAEGITEEIITGMSRFPYLRVIAHGSTLRYANQAVDLRTVGKELGARYVMEGSLRQAGARLRIAAQLVDSTTGTQLWVETYDRAFQPEAIFDLQDDVVPKIVSTVGDTQGILPHSMSEAVWSKSADQLTPYEAALRSFSYMRRVSAENHAAARDALERAVEKAPGNGLALAMLAIIFREEYNHGFNQRPDPLGRALAVARRAVDAEPTNYLAHHALASVHFFRRELQAFRSEAEQAFQLNPMDGFTFGYLGMLTAFAGDWDRGCSLSDKGRSVNPHHPGWYWFAPLFDAFRKQEYRLVLELAQKINMPNFWRTNIALAAAYGHLGELEPAGKALQTLTAARPEFATSALEECLKWWNSDLADQIVDGLKKAGLAASRSSATPSLSTAKSHARITSGESRADEGFWVAVLPFKYIGNDADLAALAEGLTDDIVTGMSKFSYLRVVARTSTSRYAKEAVDVRAIAKELGARYVMEGSIRQAGPRIRIATKLVDAASGASLWAETYDRAFSAETTLDLLDDVVPRIVATVSDTQGILAHNMTEALRNRDPESLSPYEALLRSFGFHQHVSASEHLAGRTAMERAVKQAPDRADCWAMLSWLYRAEYTHGYNSLPDPMDRALAAARRAVDLAPSSQFAQAALATSFFFRRELGAFRNAAERALALNNMEGYITAFLGYQFAFSGDWERGCALAERSTQLNPSHPGWYWLPMVLNAYRLGDFQRALELALKVNMPGLWTAQVAFAVIYTQMEEMQLARKAVHDLLAIRPDFAAIARKELAKWWLPELVQQMLTDLRKAGLDIPDAAAAPVLSSGASPARTTSGEVRTDEGFWVAVLPFKYTGSNAELKALAEGLSEEVIIGLSRFSYLRVIARGSTAKYSSESGDIRAIGKELGARYVMEGSLRQAGSKLRLAVQLVEATTGAHLWAESYERVFQLESVFELHDELVPRIVSTVADRHGVLPHSMSEAVQAKDLEHLTPYEAVLLSFSYAERITSEEQSAAKVCLERAAAQVPGYADAWAMLAMLFCDEYGLGFTLESSLLERALEAARRAVKAGPSNHLAYQNLAYAHFLRREFGPCRNAAERSLALNSMDGSNVWFMGLLIAYMGDWERGCALVERAMQLNPNFPGKYRYPLVANAYRKGDYRGALNESFSMNLPDVFYTPLNVAAAAGQLGERPTAEKALRDLLGLKPDIAAIARESLGTWFQPELVEHLIEGLVKAGLEIPAASAVPATTPSAKPGPRTASGESRADEGFWVAVLPFKYTGANADLRALAEGLSEEVITGLSRFSYLRVIARGSTAKYSSESGDVRAIGKELGARYVMEGSLRQAGSKLRLAVQLVDTVSGAHLWAENYERNFSPESLFELQDDLVPRIVSTVADVNGVLPRSMSESLRSRSPEQLSPYEAVLRSFGYFERVTPEEMNAAVAGIETALQKTPAYADAWAMLALLSVQRHAQGFDRVSDSLTTGAAAARKAVEAAPANHLAWFSLSQVLFFQKEFRTFRHAAERALALNPMDSNSLALNGEMLALSGEWERGVSLAARARQLNPHHPGWYWHSDFNHAYRQHDYRAALEIASKMNQTSNWGAWALTAAACGQLGDREGAAKAVRELLKLRPDAISRLQEDCDKWFDPEHAAHILEGFRKAGLPTDAPGSA